MNEWRRLSHLPQSEAYWQRLQDRMQRSAHAAADSPIDRKWSLAPFAWSAVAAMAAAVAAVVYGPQPTSPASGASSVAAALIAPADPVGAAWAARSGPPDAFDVLLAESGPSR